MEKGLIILLAVFVVVGILHFVSMRSLALPPERKKKLRKIVWYLYGAMFMVLGLLRQLDLGGLSLLNSMQMAIGGLILTLNYFNKI